MNTNKPAEKDIVPCAICGRGVVWMPIHYGDWVQVEAEPDDSDQFYRPPFAGELKYVHGQHKLHFCQENPNVT
jgi:hypothetical protein